MSATFPSRDRSRAPRLWPLALLSVGLVGGGIAGVWQQRDNAARTQAALQDLAERTAARLQQRMRSYEHGLLGARAVVIDAGDAMESVTREQFRRFALSMDLPRQFPGVRGFAYVRRVPAAQEDEFVAAARRDGAPGFTVWQLAPHDGERFVLQYMEPSDGNKPLLGLDLASEPRRREAALAALRDGQARITAPLTLVNSPPGARTVLMMLPVYRSVTVPEPVQRDALVIGWVQAPLLMDEVLQNFGDEQGQFAWALSDATGAGAPERFHRSASWTPDGSGPWLDLPVYGRTWRLELQPRPAFLAQLDLRSPAAVAAWTAATALLLALLLHVALRADAQQRRALQQRTESAVEHARLLEAAQAMRAQLELVLDTVSDAFFTLDRDWRFTYVNPQAERMLGMTRDTLLGRVLWQACAPAGGTEFEQAYRQAMDSGQVQVFEAAYAPLGRWFDVRAYPGPQGLAVYFQDITERRQAAERLRAAQARIEQANATLEQQVQRRTAELQAILASAASAIVATDLSGRITAFNPAAERMFELPALQAVGRPVLDLYDPAELAEHGHDFPPEVRAVLLPGASGLPVDGDGGPRSEWGYVRADGSRFPGLLSVSVLRDAQGEPLGLLGVVTDLSERKALEDALRRRTAQAEAASQAKSAFLARMSHEFRTPLNAVIGLSHLLGLLEGLPERAAQYARHIHQAGEQLLELTNDVLDLSRLEAGTLRLEQVGFELPAMLQGVAATLEPRAEAKGLSLRLELAPGLPCQVVGDPLRLRQVLLHLGDNAVKFTTEGQVVLRAFRAADAPQEGATAMLCFEVEDTGIGIDPAQQGRVFEPFAQVDGSTTRRFGGTGAGLSIVRRLVDMMGGQLSLHSRPGHGTCVAVTLELAQPDRGADPALAA